MTKFKVMLVTFVDGEKKLSDPLCGYLFDSKEKAQKHIDFGVKTLNSYQYIEEVECEDEKA